MPEDSERHDDDDLSMDPEAETIDSAPAAPPADLAGNIAPLAKGRGPDATGQRIGEYTIKNVIGSGGMGTVYLAQQENPRRPVALKVMKHGMASRSALRRFEFESQVLGRLRHPNIAQVFGAGTHDDGTGGTPYFAMEYVPNARTLTEYAASRQLATRERLALFAKVCDAVHHGHQKGIIHRDLKPGNILVDSGGEPKIIDFGVARATDSDMAVTTLQTDVGQLIGTLQYMSPEQCDADPHDLDIRSDVYALGVVLYELLCERPPYDLRRAAIHEAARLIREEAPTRPSSVNRLLRGDIETITLKALEKERARRYQSAADFGNDISRYLRNEPIEARPASALYQLRKFATRNRAVVIASCIILLSLVGGIIGTSLMYAQSEHQRGLAVIAQGVAEVAEGLAEERRERAEEAEALAEDRREQAEQARDDLEVVANFQASMIDSINPQAMGINLLRTLREHVRAGLREQSSTAEELDDAMTQLNSLAARVNPTDFARAVIDENILQRAAATLDREYADQPLIEAAIRATIGQAYFALAKAELAEPHVRRALMLHREHAGEDDIRTYGSANDLGLVLSTLARYEDAEDLIETQLERQRSLLGDEHAVTLTTMSNLAILRKDQGRYEDAEALHKQVLDTRTRLLGRDNSVTVTSINNLAVLYQGQGRSTDAMVLFAEALAIYERIAGEESRNTLSTMNNLGLVYEELGKFEQAGVLLQRALAVQRRVLGDEHPDTMTSLSNLASLRIDQERYDDAGAMLNEVYETTLALLGDQHPDTLLAINNLAAVYNVMQAYHRAEPLLVLILEQQTKMLGRDDVMTQFTLNNLAFAYDMQGKTKPAEELYREALENRLRLLGEDSLDTMLSMYNLGRLYQDSKDYVQADDLLGQAVANARQFLPEGHPYTPIFIAGYGGCLIDLERFAEAEAALTEAYPMLVGIFGEDGERTQNAVVRLVRLYEQWKKQEMAEEWRGRLADGPFG